MGYDPNDKPTICGTPNYLAPEVLQHKGHRPLSDIWSLGCVLVVLLTGRAPFEGASTQETYDLIVQAQLKLPAGDNMTLEVCDFLRKVLIKDYKIRMSVEDALRHTFITQFN